MMGKLSVRAQRVQDVIAAAGLELEVRELPASTRTAAEAAGAIGCEVSPAPAHRAGILMIKPAADVDALAEACLERRIAVSVRRGRLRLSPHLYNNEDDIDALVDLLRDPSPNM